MTELDGIRAKMGKCPPGEAVVTRAGRLNAQYIFHTVGPVYRGGEEGEADELASCYRECLQLAAERGVKTIAFPAISKRVMINSPSQPSSAGLELPRSFSAAVSESSANKL